MNDKLIWVPLENATRVNIPFELIPDGGGKMIYQLPSDLTFGHLELNGVDITGYFSPEDDAAFYVCRPWMVAGAEVAPAPPDEADESEQED